MIQIANNIKKPSKKDCLKILKEMAVLYPDSMHEFAKLYTYFMPGIPIKPKTVFQWVAKAVSNPKYCKELLKLVYIDKENIVATDDYRLHVAPNSDNLEPGYYCPKTSDYLYPLDKYDYPDYKKLLSNVEGHSIQVKTTTLKEVNQIIRVCLNEGPEVNKKYLDDALCFCEGNIFYGKNENNLVKVITPKGIAIIMPMVK